MFRLKFNDSDGKSKGSKYKIEAIYDNAVYAKELERG